MSEGLEKVMIMQKRETQKFERLYAQFLNTLTLQGYSQSTIEAYTFALKRCALYFDRCPDKRLTKDELKQYFADLLKTHSWSTIRRDRNGLQRFFELILEHEWDWVAITNPPSVKTLPDILSPQEINRVLERIQKPQYAVLCFILYTMGLRIGEALNLQIGDIDGEHKRVHIRQGKGKKDRYTQLPEATYQLLRQFWASHRHKKWIFPSQQPSRSNLPMDRGSAQKAIQEAVVAAGIRKHITAHSFRHCYATHLIETGLNLRAVQHLMGHADPRTTALYTQLTTVVQQDALACTNVLANRLLNPLASGGEG